MAPGQYAQITLKSAVTNNVGLIASGVGTVRFTFNQAQIPDGGDAGNYQPTNYREIEVVGTATVPEPSSLALLAIGGVAFLTVSLRRRVRA